LQSETEDTFAEDIVSLTLSMMECTHNDHVVMGVHHATRVQHDNKNLYNNDKRKMKNSSIKIEFENESPPAKG
jgi:hypothetical protein